MCYRPPLQTPPTLTRAAHSAVQGPVVVAVMDGVGLGPQDAGNAVYMAHTPTLDAAMAQHLWVPLAAHGPAVGLAGADDMGNSEVGHNALGSGQIYDQGAKRVAEAVADGSLFAGPVWGQVMARCCGDHAPALHLVGLLSDGNVHSHLDHALAMLNNAHAQGVQRAFVHVLLDGRDVGRTSAHTYAARLEACLAAINAHPHRAYQVASGGGRMHITMDRYQADWPMVERGWRCHVRGEGRRMASLTQAIATLRQETPGIADQDLPAFVVAQGPISDGDAVVLFNFRGDRMLELVDALSQTHFTGFARGPKPDVLLAGMTLYDGDTHRPEHFLVQPPQLRHTLSELLERAGIEQLACSETQKFGHVTYFWNGNRTTPFAGERCIEVPSLPAPFDAHPGMRAQQVAEAVVQALSAKRVPLCRLNFANGDMVGHTGNFAATCAAMESVDRALALLQRKVVDEMGGVLIITADHGNAEDMVERDKKTGEPLRDGQGIPIAKTSHSLHPVPCIFVLPKASLGKFVLSPVDKPGLANVAASCATLLGWVPPAGLWQPSLLQPAPGG